MPEGWAFLLGYELVVMMMAKMINLHENAVIC